MSVLLNTLEKTLLNERIAVNTNTEAVNLSRTTGFAIAAVVDVSTTDPLNFTSADVNVANNTITITDHGLATAQSVETSTSGTLPGNVANSSFYRIIVVDENTIQLAETEEDALNGIPVDFSSAGSGSSALTPVALSGASVKLQGSVDGETFVDIAGTSNNITSFTRILWNVSDAQYKYVRVACAVSAGNIWPELKVIVKSLV